MAATLLHYEIREKLGEGGMGVVYKALDRKLNRFVALKFLPPKLTADSASIERFLQEAKALSAVNHPRIATLYDFCDDGEQRFLAMEYLPGGTLKTRLQGLSSTGQTLPIEEALEYACQTAEGLAHAHRRGIVHRDVKTSNLMLTEEGGVKITDFGVAKLKSSGLVTTPGSLVGTAVYMSPEQAQGMEVDERSDIFSFGIVLFELVTGGPPFEAANEVALLAKVATAPAPLLRSYRPDAPAALERIVAKTLQKRREDRYQSMDDLLGELKKLRPGVTSHTLSEPRRADPHAARVPRRRRILVAGAFAIILAAVVLALSPPIRERVPEWLGFNQIPAERLLAVLPFHNVDGDRASNAFSAGLVEILTNKLAQLEGSQGALRVVSANEVLKEKVTGAREARITFGATLALTGSVQRAGDKVIVTANVVDTKTQLVLAARDIEARNDNLSALQEMLVQKVTEMLDLKLQPEARRTLAAGLTPSASAYEFYLQGRGYLQRFDRADSLENALTAFQQALSLDPSYALAYAGSAEASLRKYQLTKDPRFLARARTSGLRAVQLNDQLSPVHLTMGLIHLSSGEYEEAIKSFETSLRVQPGSADAYRELANAYDAADRKRDAEATYRQGIQLRPNYWAGYKDLGLFFVRHGQLEEALPYFQRVVDLTPDNYSGYRNLGGLYLRLRQFSKASAMLEKSLAIKPTGIAYSNLGSVYFHEKRYREALDMFLKATELNPTDARVWGNLGDAIRQTSGSADESARAYHQAIDLMEKQLTVNPRDAQLKAFLGSFWSALGNKEKALAEINDALQLNPTDGEVLLRAALVYEGSGMRDRALQAIERAVKGGYSVEEIQGWPPLEGLRQDPRYQKIVEDPSVKRQNSPITPN